LRGVVYLILAESNENNFYTKGVFFKRVFQEKRFIKMVRYKNTAPLPVTGKALTADCGAREMKPLQVKVEKKLYDAAFAAARNNRRTMREVITWALREYVFMHNPGEAARMGIYAAVK
jgi:hypothetical protein